MHGGAPELGQDEAFARIRLLRSPHIGPISYAQLLRRFGTAATALEALPDLAARGGREYRAAPAERIEREVDAVRRVGARYLFHDQPSYPPLLAQLDSAPPILIAVAWLLPIATIIQVSSGAWPVNIGPLCALILVVQVWRSWSNSRGRRRQPAESAAMVGN